MKIERSYTHKSFGPVGKVELTVPAEGWSIDGHELNEQAVQHLATFALQTLQDAYAGAKTSDEAQANWEKKLDRIVKGVIGVREGGVRNPVLARAITIAKGHAPADVKKDAKRLLAWAKGKVGSNPAYMHLAEKQLAEEAEMLGVSVDELPDEAEGDEE